MHMLYKITSVRLFRSELDIDVESFEQDMEIASKIREGEIPEGAIRSDEVGIEELNEEV